MDWKPARLGPLALLLLVSIAGAAATARDTLPTPAEPALVLAGKRILHVGAHPDDEWTFAPMLAEACRFRGATCHLVVAQDADSWGCLMTLGLKDRDRCSRMRRLETAASAANLNASHEFYGWREGLHDWSDAGVRSNLAALADEVGGHAKLVARFRQTLDTFRPELVLAFDPRHGTTCHPNHRAVVQLLLEAIDGLPPSRRPEVWFGSDYGVPGAPPAISAITDDFGLVRWPDDPTPVTWYDMTVALPDGRTGYDYLVDALRLNASQFGEVATGRRTPSPVAEHRRLPLVRLADIDPHQAGLCEGRAPPMLQRLGSMSPAALEAAAPPPVPSAGAYAPDAMPIPVFDGHVDVMVHFAKPDYSGWKSADAYDLGGPAPGQVDIPRLQAGGVAGGLFTVAVLDADREKGLREAMALLRAIAARHADALAVVHDSAGLEQARREGKVAMLPGIEGGEQLGGRVETLRAAQTAGVRAVTLTWNRSNELGDSGSDVARHGGLSPLGGEFVDEMNRLGMLVDLSHAADATVRDVLARSRDPVLFSHSGARALCDSPRNLPDALLRAVAANGGLVMVPFVPYLVRTDYLEWYERGQAEWARLKAAHPGDEPAARAAMAAWEAAHPAPAVSVTDVADHVEHVRRVAGLDHVGLGSDFDGMYSNVPGLEDPSRLPALFAELARRGWREAELRQLAYGNFLRLLRSVEKNEPG